MTALKLAQVVFVSPAKLCIAISDLAKKHLVSYTPMDRYFSLEKGYEVKLLKKR